MPFQNIEFAAGITKDGTEYSERGRYTDGSRVRFRKNRAEKIGGWKTIGRPQTTGISQDKFFEGHSRDIKSWISTDGSRYCGIGTELKYYIKQGESFYDVTPVDAENSGSSSFSVMLTATAGASTIRVLFRDNDTGVLVNRPSSLANSDTIHFSAFGAGDMTFSNFTAEQMSAGFTVTQATFGAFTIVTVPVPTTCTQSTSKFFYATELTTTFTTVNGSSTLKVTTNTALSLTLNSYVIISGATALGGGSNITAEMVNQEYQITSIIDSTNFEVELRDPTSGAAVAAGAAVSGAGGSNVVLNVLLASGLNTYVKDIGFGAGVWNGNFGWGYDATLDPQNQLRVWSSDNFGEDLMVCARGLSIYRWDTSTGFTDTNNTRVASRMEKLSSIDGANLVPTKALAVTVSEVDRHLIVLGCDPLNTGGTARTGTIDPMLIAFSDQEDNLEFEPKLTNTAGSVRLSSGSTIIGSIKNRQETVIFTDTAVYSMQFIGPPLTFAVNLINEGSGLIGPKACVNGPSGIFFASKTGFFIYTGAVRALPCTVQDHIFSDIDLDQAFKCFMGINSEFDEMWFFYPSKTDATGEVSRYAIYNYVDNNWSIGSLVRYAWEASGVQEKPYATFSTNTQDGRLYEHENGFDDDQTAMSGVFVQSSDIDISSGNNFTFVRKILPDVEFKKDPNQVPSGKVSISLQTKDFPMRDRQTDTDNIVEASENTGLLHVRARARAVALKFESDETMGKGYAWQVGTTRLDITASGGRS